MKPLFGNAELQRNLWLEMTPQRLIVGPLVIALMAVTRASLTTVIIAITVPEIPRVVRLVVHASADAA